MTGKARTKIDIRDGQVYSARFGDIYFSRDDGPAESEYVFLEGNGLPAAWRDKSRFCIGETGFGTGLNFLVTLSAWLDDASHCDTLDYFAIEKYPLNSEQLKTIYLYWPDYRSLAGQLLKQYPSVSHGCHTLTFADGRVQLHLVFESVEHALFQYRFDPDSWFLDGFAPAKNPSMWHSKVLNRIAEQSRPGATLATFTAAGEVRRKLLAAGFEVRKRKGFGRKREMLCAARQRTSSPSATFADNPWFTPPDISSIPRNVAVIGAGIAGIQVAWHLAQRGVNVQLIEQLDRISSAASGNLAGILAPRLTACATEGESFYVAAFLYQLRQLESLLTQGAEIGFEQQGLLQLAHNTANRRRFLKLAERTDLPAELLQIIAPEYVSRRLGENTSCPGLLIEQAAALSPSSLCQALLNHPRIELRLATTLEELVPHACGPKLKISGSESIHVDAVVLANGYQAQEFAGMLDICPVRGQTSTARLSPKYAPAHMLGHAGYAISQPGIPQTLVFGASYERNDFEVDLRADETRQNLDSLSSCLPGLAGRLTDVSSSHAGIRATTADRWPVVGPMVEADFYLKEYADLHQGKQFKAYPRARYATGVYLLTGLGSRGLASAAYCANILSHMMLGSAPPASLHQLHALHPGRFLIRKLRKRKFKDA